LGAFSKGGGVGLKKGTRGGNNLLGGGEQKVSNELSPLFQKRFWMATKKNVWEKGGKRS